ncbi:alanine aminotransferase 2-like [Clupea harengus]|uniref:alanine transaminase n=1 Tax=Clupea harengus TaxID=7950 RepID=A0A6P8G5U7_CLUHA|nr:alanine aminotransferase 2-like [Clupea harengus]
MALLSDVERLFDEELQKQADHIRQQLAMGVKKAYKEVVDVSFADAHRTGMTPITFVRQVLAACLYPDLLLDDTLPVDVRQRAERMLGHCDGGSVGVGLAALPYRLQEKSGWTLEKKELQRVIQASRGRCNPRAIYISNPGDPTGHVHNRKTIQDVVRFAAEENLLLLVDEVYQDCVFGHECEFLSYKRALFEMGPVYSGSVKMASFNSLSNGTMGECGMRAGYMELVNFDDAVLPFVEILLTGDISPPVTGQIGLDVMADPPRPGEPSHSRYMQELLSCKNTLRQNVERGRNLLSLLPGIHCPPVMGGVYLYTHLTLPQVMGVSAGPLYCGRLLEEEGVCVGLSECVCDDLSATGSCWHISWKTCWDVLDPFTFASYKNQHKTKT